MDISRLLIIFFITYIGLVVVKLLFYICNVKAREKIDGAFIAIPFSSLQIEQYIAKKNLVTDISKNKAFIIELFGGLTFFIYTFSIINVVSGNIMPVSEALLFIVLTFYFVGALMYFALNDILRLNLPTGYVRYFLLSVISISLIIGAYRFIIYRTSGESVLNYISLGYLDNLLAALILAGIALLFIKLKTGLLGLVDLDLILILGLILGFPNSFVAIFFLSFIGTIISVIYSLRIKKFNGVKVPFAPFLLLGYIIALGFGHLFIELLQRI